MELLAAIGAWPGAAWLRGSGTAYLFVNAAHILGIGLLLGAILPLDLRLMGCLRTVSLEVLGPFLTRSAAVGLAIALPTGLWLFSVRPTEYAANTAFLIKMALLLVAFANIALVHAGSGFRRATAGGPVSPGVRLCALASFLLWLGVLLAGRWIGFL